MHRKTPTPLRAAFALAPRAAAALALVLTLAAWPAAGAAQADVGTQIIERCTHGQSLGGFSQQDYRQALEETPAEVNEYSDCVNRIHKAQLAAAGRGGAGSSGGSSGTLTANVPPPTPAEQQTLQAPCTTPAPNP